jgi:hypothetical protein
MKARLLGVALLATMALAACDDDDDNNEPQPQGRVRAIHLSPDAPAVDVLVDGNQALANVTYLVASDYLDVDAGNPTFRVEAVGSNDAVIEAEVPVADGVDYTLLAVNTLANIEPLYLTDDNTAPAAGQARVRVIHGAPSVGPVDVYFTAPGDPLGVPSLTNFAFKSVSTLPNNGGNYITVPAGTYQVRVTPAGTPGTVAIDQEIVVPAGVVATAIATETPGGGAPFAIEVYVDAGL